MSRSLRRIDLTPGYLLHQRPWRDSSRILEVFTREHGRLTLFARGVRGPNAKLSAVLQPFRLLLLSWSGRGEAPALTTAERGEHGAALPPACFLPSCYLNELLLRLTTRHDPLPQLFDDYHGTLSQLAGGAALEPCLRLFEKRLLEQLGYGLDLASEAHSAQPIEAQRCYEFRPGQGFIAARAHPAALRGQSLLSLAAEDLHEGRVLEDARRVLSAALAQVLEGRPLATRAVAKSMKRRAAQ
jgi:DNA repair protein RecO (recombination protein O)